MKHLLEHILSGKLIFHFVINNTDSYVVVPAFDQLRWFSDVQARPSRVIKYGNTILAFESLGTFKS